MKCPVLPVELKYIQILTENNLDFLKNVNFIQPFGQLQLTYISEELYYIEKTKLLKYYVWFLKSFYSCGFYKFPNNWSPPCQHSGGGGGRTIFLKWREGLIFQPVTPCQQNGGAFRKELNPDFYGTMVDNFLIFCDCKLQTIFLPYILLFKM